jgi:hypothetical protein
LTGLRSAIGHPVNRRLVWFAFLIAFYQSGLEFTTLVLEPDTFEGGIQWLWAGSFPLMLPAFFYVSRWIGCGSGACSTGVFDSAQPERRRPNAGADAPGVFRL